MRKYTLEEFIGAAIQVHGNIYDYSEFEYIYTMTPSTIICSKHGRFQKAPFYHLRGRGCSKCLAEARSQELSEYASRPRYKARLKQDDFLTRCREIHQNYYDYSKVEYVTSKSRIIIGCPTHGFFDQMSTEHIRGRGCQKCVYDNLRKTLPEFIKKSQIIHNSFYDYSEVDYVGDGIKITIICPIHGRFEQTPSNHLRGKRCPCCANNKRSKMSQLWLDQMGITNEFREIRLTIGQKTFEVDGYDHDTNTVYEFWGDYWHGNPDVFAPSEINTRTGRTFGELYETTQNRRREILGAGYKLIEIWEKDYKNQN